MVENKKLFVMDANDFSSDVVSKVSEFFCSAPFIFCGKVYFAVPYSERYDVASMLG